MAIYLLLVMRLMYGKVTRIFVGVFREAVDFEIVGINEAEYHNHSEKTNWFIAVSRHHRNIRHSTCLRAGGTLFLF